MPGFPVHNQLPQLAQTHVHWVGDANQPSQPLLMRVRVRVRFRVLLTSPAIFPSIRVFPNESVLRIRWPKCWSFNICPSNEYSWLISIWVEWFDLLAALGILKSLLQRHRSKPSILWRSAFFMVQLSYSYMTTGKPQLWLYRPLSAKWCLCFIMNSQ